MPTTELQASAAENQRLTAACESTPRTTTSAASAPTTSSPPSEPVTASSCATPGGEAEQVEVGVFRTPAEFAEEAKRVAHPMDQQLAVKDWAKSAIFRMLTTKPDELTRERTELLKKVLRRRCKLEKDEAKLHAGLPDHVQVVMRTMKILLFKSLLEEYGYDDMGVVDLLVHGVPLSGVNLSPAMQMKSGSTPPRTEPFWRRSPCGAGRLSRRSPRPKKT